LEGKGKEKVLVLLTRRRDTNYRLQFKDKLQKRCTPNVRFRA